jgi:hypothetical protein
MPAVHLLASLGIVARFDASLPMIPTVQALTFIFSSSSRRTERTCAPGALIGNRAYQANVDNRWCSETMGGHEQDLAAAKIAPFRVKPWGAKSMPGWIRID